MSQLQISNATVASEKSGGSIRASLSRVLILSIILCLASGVATTGLVQDFFWFGAGLFTMLWAAALPARGLETALVVSFAIWYLPPTTVNLGFKGLVQPELGLTLIGIPFLIRCWAKGTLRYHSSLGRYLLVYCIFFLQAVLRSPLPSFSRFALDGSREIAQFLFAVLCYFVVINFLSTESSCHRLARGLFLGAFAGVILSFLIFAFAPSSNALVLFAGLGYENYGLAEAAMQAGPSLLNIYNGYPLESSLVGLLLMWTMPKAVRHPWMKRAGMILFPLGLMAGSRAGLLSTFCMLTAYLVFGRGRKRLYRMAILVVAVGVLLGMVYGLGLPGFSEQISRTFDISPQSETEAADSSSLRLMSWEAIWQNAVKDPVTTWFGAGIGSFLRVVGPAFHFDTAEDAVNFGVTGPHSLYFDAILIGGLTCLAALLLVFWISLRKSIRVYRKAPKLLGRFGFWLFLMMVSAISACLGGGSLNNANLIFYVALISACYDLFLRNRHRTSKTIAVSCRDGFAPESQSLRPLQP